MSLNFSKHLCDKGNVIAGFTFLKKLRNKSSRLLEDIDAKLPLEDKHLKTIPNSNIEDFFYEIRGKEACMANSADILKKQPQFIAIFLIEAGKFVIFSQ